MTVPEQDNMPDDTSEKAAMHEAVPSIFSDFDLYLFGQGENYRIYEKMGDVFVLSMALLASISQYGHQMHSVSLSSVTLTTGIVVQLLCIYGITTWVYGNVL